MSDKSEEEDHDMVSKQIVDYYRKYSQNRDLPKYFSGTSLSYMPPIVKEDEITSKPTIVIDDTNTETLVAEDPKPVSPTSSVTSNRKLEWDNGADIGYNNCTNLHKSISLPILLGSGDTKSVIAVPKTKLSRQIVNIVSYTIENGDKQVSTSSSSPSFLQEQVPVESTSSSARSNPKPVSTSSSSFNSKIGSPYAESTPKMYSETPRFVAKKRSINLCITKPIVVQCEDKKKKRYDKNMQTSFNGGVSKSIQTSASLEALNQCIQKPELKKENQSIILIHYDSDSDKRTCSSNTQTECDSFRYYKGVSSNSSKDSPVLAQLITEKQSKSLIRDVDRSIDLLQKLLKSKKYDPVTKKRYIKKIVQKIVDNKYNEDSTTSSELFVSKKPVSKFTVKTFSDEFLPKRNVENQSSVEKNVSSDSYQSWKEDKTNSEKILEQHKGQGDQLINFAVKEREHQLAWINDEISHLTKLKGLLENKVRTTTVYMVSGQYNSRPNSSSSSSNPCRNYVIQTELSSGSSSDYNVHAKSGKINYRVTETSEQAQVNIGRRVVGDIQVVSDDKTTNINVKARKINEEMFQPKAPALVGSGKYDTFPRSKAEEERCWPCGKLKPQIHGSTGAKYSFEVPLNSGTNFVEKINDIIHKYTTGASAAKNCKCRCKCMDNHKTPLVASKPSVEYEPCSCCKCKEHLKPPLIPSKPSIPPETVEHVQPCPCCKCKEYLKPPLIPSKPQEIVENKQPCLCCKCKEYLKPPLIPSKSFEPPKIVDHEQPCACCKCKETFRISEPTTSTFEQAKKLEFDQECQCCGSRSSKSTEIEEANCQTDECECCHKQVQTCICNKQESTTGTQHEKSTAQSSSISTSTITTSSTGASTSESVQSCLCCKRKNVTSKRLYALRKKISDQAYPLCRPCYRQNRRCAHAPNYYSNPGHVCNCYTVVETKTLNEIKKTITDLNELEQYCTCTDFFQNKTSADYCQYCKCKLKKTSKNRNGIAYMLTFENDLRKEDKKKKDKKQYLEEIKIKIPVSYRKKHKDKENKKKKKAKKNYDSEDTSSSEVRRKPINTLQEYLCKNRPDFVEEAEGRRRTVNETRTQREEMSDYNKILFLKKCQEECEKNAKRLFSAKEMKEITRRNYKKCPEVQQRLNDNRDRQLRQASRLMADTFNKKLRENVLKGKRNLPTNAKVINM